MNSIAPIDVYYLRPSRTLETIEIKDSIKSQLVYVYSYEGQFYTLFKDLGELIAYFKDDFDSTIVFERESELDQYLEKMTLD